MLTFLLLLPLSSCTTCEASNVHLVCTPGSGCVNGTCGTCSTNSDCNSQFTCTSGECIHKSIFPLTWQTWIAMIGAFGISILGGATGMGGGSFVVPIFSLVNAFITTNSIGLAQATILGNGLTSFVLGCIHRHPHRNRPRIYCDAVFVMVAPLLAGSFLGVFVASFMPQYVIMILLLIFLVYTAIKTVKRAYRTTKKENQERAKAKAIKDGDHPLTSPVPSPALSPLDMQPANFSNLPKPTPSVSSEYQSFDGEIAPEQPSSGAADVELTERPKETHPPNNNDFSVEMIPHNETQPNPDQETDIAPTEPTAIDLEEQKMQRDSTYIPETTDPVLAKIYKREKRLGFRKTIFIVCCWILLFLVSLFRGAKGAPSIVGLKRCSAGDWAIFGSYLVVSLLLTALSGFLIMKEQTKKTKLGYESGPGDVVWTVKTSVVYPLFCILAGFVAGLLGIGGALVTSPVLLDMGVLVPVVTATTSALLLLTSSSSTAQFAVGGMLPWDFGLCFFILGLLGAIVGGFVSVLSGRSILMSYFYTLPKLILRNSIPNFIPPTKNKATQCNVKNESHSHRTPHPFQSFKNISLSPPLSDHTPLQTSVSFETLSPHSHRSSFHTPRHSLHRSSLPPSSPMSQSPTKSLQPIVPLPYSSSLPLGYDNFGSTCYLSSILVALSSLPPFMTSILSSSLWGEIISFANSTHVSIQRQASSMNSPLSPQLLTTLSRALFQQSFSAQFGVTISLTELLTRFFSSFSDSSMSMHVPHPSSSPIPYSSSTAKGLDPAMFFFTISQNLRRGHCVEYQAGEMHDAQEFFSDLLQLISEELSILGQDAENSDSSSSDDHSMETIKSSENKSSSTSTPPATVSKSNISAANEDILPFNQELIENRQEEIQARFNTLSRQLLATIQNHPSRYSSQLPKLTFTPLDPFISPQLKHLPQQQRHFVHPVKDVFESVVESTMVCLDCLTTRKHRQEFLVLPCTFSTDHRLFISATIKQIIQERKNRRSSRNSHQVPSPIPSPQHGGDPTSPIGPSTEMGGQKGGQKNTPSIHLSSLLDSFFSVEGETEQPSSDENGEGQEDQGLFLECEKCRKKTRTTMSTLLASLPPVLAIQINRFAVINQHSPSEQRSRSSSPSLSSMNETADSKGTQSSSFSPLLLSLLSSSQNSLNKEVNALSGSTSGSLGTAQMTIQKIQFPVEIPEQLDMSRWMKKTSQSSGEEQRKATEEEGCEDKMEKDEEIVGDDRVNQELDRKGGSHAALLRWFGRKEITHANISDNTLPNEEQDNPDLSPLDTTPSDGTKEDSTNKPLLIADEDPQPVQEKVAEDEQPLTPPLYSRRERKPSRVVREEEERLNESRLRHQNSQNPLLPVQSTTSQEDADSPPDDPPSVMLTRDSIVEVMERCFWDWSVVGKGGKRKEGRKKEARASERLLSRRSSRRTTPASSVSPVPIQDIIQTPLPPPSFSKLPATPSPQKAQKKEVTPININSDEDDGKEAKEEARPTILTVSDVPLHPLNTPTRTPIEKRKRERSTVSTMRTRRERSESEKQRLRSHRMIDLTNDSSDESQERLRGGKGKGDESDSSTDEGTESVEAKSELPKAARQLPQLVPSILPDSQQRFRQFNPTHPIVPRPLSAINPSDKQGQIPQIRLQPSPLLSHSHSPLVAPIVLPSPTPPSPLPALLPPPQIPSNTRLLFSPLWTQSYSKLGHTISMPLRGSPSFIPTMKSPLASGSPFQRTSPIPYPPPQMSGFLPTHVPHSSPNPFTSASNAKPSLLPLPPKMAATSRTTNPPHPASGTRPVTSTNIPTPPSKSPFQRSLRPAVPPFSSPTSSPSPRAMESSSSHSDISTVLSSHGLNDLLKENTFSRIVEESERNSHAADSDKADVDCDKQDSRYDLFGIVVHHGPTVSSGHYTAAVRDVTQPLLPSNSLSWLIFNDLTVTRRSLDEILADKKIVENAYLLFYVRHSSL
ncbi:hypothetical protein BLNAU_8941 [Blattamonas nauphoetae]|uniref:USP domain-containing protein n=1 Tax=Blattamonas nauphoetae TaxID=2049346 RepID=A0ABQ9XXF1_9EUKA|nr:hypothetical protein BLNAU_8941 [Blattamonas nauphoetae]